MNLGFYNFNIQEWQNSQKFLMQALDMNIKIKNENF